MAGPHTRRNLLSGDKDELAAGAPTDVSGTPVPTPAVSQAPTPAPASAPDPPGRYTDEDLQRATKLASKLFVKAKNMVSSKQTPHPASRP